MPVALVMPGVFDIFMTASTHTKGLLKGCHHLFISMLTTITNLSIHSGGAATMLVLITAVRHMPSMAYRKRARHIQRTTHWMLAMVPYTYGQMATLAPKITGLSCHEAPPSLGQPLASATTTSPGNVSITLAVSMMLAVCVYMTARIMRGLQRGRAHKGKQQQNQHASILDIDTPHKSRYTPPASASATEQYIFSHNDNSLIVKLG